MSTFIGSTHERWSLARAVDALGDAARQAGPPGLLWLAGVLYPALSLGPGPTVEAAVQSGRRTLQGHLDAWADAPIVWLPFLLPFIPRLWVGLARIGAPETWRELTRARRAPRLRDAWRAGRGLTLSALGLWLEVVLLSLSAAAVLVGLPTWITVRLAHEVSPLFYASLVLLAPLVAFLLAYLLLLSLLFQLALHSLAHNRRGATSALIHAWRIVKNDPWATARATIVDFVLYATVWITALVVATLVGLTCVGLPLVPLVFLGLFAFLGVARACYWARAYRALGGLSADDHVPGLEPQRTPAEAG